MDGVDLNHHKIYNKIILFWYLHVFFNENRFFIILGWSDYRHEGYYVFITNETVEYNETSSLDPVYHDKEAKPSFQNTMVFPGGYYGRQIYLFVNSSADIVIEPCEVEIFGMVCTAVSFQKIRLYLHIYIQFSNTELDTAAEL